MAQFKKVWLGVFIFVAAVGVAEAKVQIEIKKRVSNTQYSFASGSVVRLNFGSGRVDADGMFLGRVVNSDGSSDEFMFLDLLKTRAYMIDKANVSFKINPGKTQPILRGMFQYGGTCAAFAMTHFWQQYYLAGQPGSEALQTMMSAERYRTQFFEEVSSRYYMGRNIELGNLMKQLGKRFGANCKTKQFASGNVAADFVYGYAKIGIPVMIDFNIGPNMVNSTYETVDYEKPTAIDSRLWIPRKKGERNSGGHAIVAAAAFQAKGNRKIVMIDSDWDQPRIWDIDRYLTGRTAMKEVQFTVCGLTAGLN